VLRDLPRTEDPRALVGHETSDDAAVYAISEDTAIVETIDFFTPVVDDPYWFGRIAAANAFSDVWAMGARPLFALNLVGFPIQKLPRDTLAAILRGGADTAREAGAPILGGHSIDDPEPKYGMAVTGVVHPKQVLRNVGARPGDRLLLTKPLGSGILTTAIKRQIATPKQIDAVTELMSRLNRAAGEALARAATNGGVHALTDVTGFGLLGHAWEMAKGSGVALRLRAEAVPLLEGVVDLAGQEVVPGGSKANLAWVEEHVRFDDPISPALRIVLADAQTNGGLLAAVPAERAPAILADLAAAGVVAVDIGEVFESEAESSIEVVAG
jgi:selenide, water dikinase